MKIEVSDHFSNIFENYKKTYQQYMGYTDEEMPTDECLLIIALIGDRNVMKKNIETLKNINNFC